MAATRINVLVYSGTGTSISSLRNCLDSLRRVLSPNYAVLPISSDAIIQEPWLPSCALLVFPGGGDLGFCHVLNGEGNRRIKHYVNCGGSYLGLCAGGYYGTSKCEFEVGDEKLEVVGSRELAFFPGICRGSAFAGFQYNTEVGTRAAEVKVEKTYFASTGILPELFKVYFNGGGVFVDASKYKDRGVETLASYTEKLDVKSGLGNAAVIYCKVGEGAAILSGPHPEFAASALKPDVRGMKLTVIDALRASDKRRNEFLKACLSKLGLHVNQEDEALPTLSSMHLTSSNPSDVATVLKSLEGSTNIIDGDTYVKGEADIFHFKEETLSPTTMLAKLAVTVEDVMPLSTSTSSQNHVANTTAASTEDEIIPKTIIAHCSALPISHETPYFNHASFYTQLDSFYATASPSIPRDLQIGRHILYGETVTSTNTLLEKNRTLTSALPTGSTFTATTQLSGRGRGSNVWLSPSGSLMFSTLLRHPASLDVHAPVIFTQYLAGLAVALAIHAYSHETHTLPIRLKWPNDIYAQTPTGWAKIGGVLVHTTVADGAYTLIVGVGLNVANAAPTVALDAVLAAALPLAQPFEGEKLLARVLGTFAALYVRFREKGWAGELEELYLKYWLHNGQIVTLEESGARARIVGLTSDWGLLLAEEIRGEEGKEVPTGWRFALQSDSNSFDFFKGLVKRKL